MKKNNIFQYLWTGLLTFWIPLVLIMYIIKTVWPLIEKLSKPIARILPFHSIGGEIVDSVIGVLLVLLISVLVGLIVQKTFLNKWTKKIDSLLSQLFPGYSFYKNYLKTNPVENKQNEWKSVLVEDDDELKLGFVIQKQDDDLCVVYIPGVPNPYEGEVIFKELSKLHKIDISFPEAVKVLRQYGKGFIEIYKKNPTIS